MPTTIPARNVGDAITATLLNVIRTDIIDIFANGDDRLRVVEAASETALRVDIGEGRYLVGSTIGSYAGGTDITVTNGATNYIMIDSAGSIQKSTSGWNASYARLAIVVCSGGAITSITDRRATAIGGSLGGGGNNFILPDNELVGEAVTQGDVLYPEKMITTAEATNEVKISDMNGNKRASFIAYGTGVSSNEIDIIVKKTATPAGALGIRIETDSSGSPSGTLVDADAYGTIAEADVGTSLGVETITLNGSFSITKGTKVHVVLFHGTYASETIDSTNYYSLGYGDRTTTSRPFQSYNGSTRGESSQTTDAHGVAFDTNQTGISTPQGVRISINNDCFINEVTKPSANTGNRAYVKDDGGTILGTAIFSGDSAVFDPPVPVYTANWYRVEIGVNTGTFTNRRKNTGISYPYTGTNIDYEEESNNGGNPGTNYLYGPTDIKTITGVELDEMAYISSDLLANSLLFKASASATDTLPDILRIASTTKSALEEVEILSSGYANIFSSLTADSVYFLSDTAGQISTTPGTVKYKVGKSTDKTDTLYLDGKDMRVETDTVGSSPYTYQNTTERPVRLTITDGTVSKIEYSRDGSTFYEVASATNFSIELMELDSIKITHSSTPTMKLFYN